MIETRLTLEEESFRIWLEHPHEIGDDLVGIQVEMDCDYREPTWRKVLGENPLALDAQNIDELIAILNVMKRTLSTLKGVEGVSA